MMKMVCRNCLGKMLFALTFVSMFASTVVDLNAQTAPPTSSKIPADVFVIEVVDDQTRRGVPLVELETIAHQRFVTDSAGRAVVTDLDLMGRKVFFTVRSHGYQFAKDGFGYEGKMLKVIGGQQATLTMTRRNIAERLYRATGSGIYIDSVRAGFLPAESATRLRGDVVGCDSVMTAEYQDKLFWFWGDTNRPHYPIGGNFHITGATTSKNLAPTIDSEPPRFDYFVDDQSAIRPVAKMAGEGPTWISAVTVLPAGKSDESPRMLANFIKVRGELEAYRWGFVIWDDKAQRFNELSATDQHPRMFPDSQVHTFVHSDQGQPFVYFCHPLPLTRVPANQAAFTDPAQYEGYTCLKEGTELADRELDRDANGQLRFAWKRNTLPLSQKNERALVAAGAMKADEVRNVMKDKQSDRRVLAHTGSVAWNKFRQRWIMIAVEVGGDSSLLGNVWYAEAPAPEGPWLSACQILSHDHYSFYNPKHHTFLDSEDGRTIYFEGTYTTSFSGNTHGTPRYDYNQIMYRLDLTRPELSR